MKRFMILAVVSGLGLSACATAAPTASRPAAQISPATTSSDPGTAADSTSKSGPAKKSNAASRKGARSEPKSCEPVRGGTEGKIAQLVDVRVGSHEAYDRVVFEFAPSSDEQYFGLPPFDLHRATPPLHEDPSGEPVSMDGSHFAWVVFHGGTGVEFDDSEDGYTITYTGPKDFKRDYRTLAEARQMGDFEATLSWGFGLNSASCWKVDVLQNPLRVAIDFPHD
jgi:hypothetical protein